MGLDSGVVRVREHEMLLIGANVRHKLKIFPDIPVECLTLSFELRYGADHGSVPEPWREEEQTLLKTLMSNRCVSAADPGSCLEEIDAICLGIGSGALGEYSKLKNRLGNFFISAAQAFGKNRKREETGDPREQDFINKAIRINDYISRNFTKALTLEMVAADLNYSTRQLQRIIKLYYNISFRELLIQYRVGYSKVLLGLTPYTLEEIAVRCGFSSLKSFEKYFKNSERMTPSAFKKIYGKCN